MIYSYLSYKIKIGIFINKIIKKAKHFIHLFV